jgi:hypothetical protein
MGMFDTVVIKIKCPYCSKVTMTDCQTKDLDCVLNINNNEWIEYFKKMAEIYINIVYDKSHSFNQLNDYDQLCFFKPEKLIPNLKTTFDIKTMPCLYILITKNNEIKLKWTPYKGVKNEYYDNIIYPKTELEVRYSYQLDYQQVEEIMEFLNNYLLNNSPPDNSTIEDYKTHLKNMY